MRGRFAAIVGVGLVCGLTSTASAQSVGPPVPKGIDPGGVTIGLLTRGIDYTKPDVAARLARDGEGEMVSFDALRTEAARRNHGPWAGDNASDDRLVGIAPGRVIAVRLSAGTGFASIEAALAFLKLTGTRLVVISRGVASAADWQPLIDAAKAWPSILFLIAADDIREQAHFDCASGSAHDPGDRGPGDQVVPSALGLSNVLVLAALKSNALPCLGDSYVWSKPDAVIAPPAAVREAPGRADAPPRDAAEAAMLAAGLIPMYAQDLKRARSAADAKRVLLSKAVRLKGLDVPVLECCAVTSR
jgi:hypothetical protein